MIAKFRISRARVFFLNEIQLVHTLYFVTQSMICGNSFSTWAARLKPAPGHPFHQPRPSRWLPLAMRQAPTLVAPPAGPAERRFALLVNPFYAKNPHGSFGKHVLTPALALTSLAAATPAHWRVAYWDENLLQGPPPVNPVPEVAGITVHLSFARRSYELAAWFKQLGSLVVLGGPHVQACQDEAAQHADAISVGDGVQTWPAILKDIETSQLKPRYFAGFERPLDLDPPPRRDLVTEDCFLTESSLIASRGCRQRCAFCYQATQGLAMPYQTRSPQAVARQLAESRNLYGVFLDNNFGADPGYVLRLCRELEPLKKIWSAAVTLEITEHPGVIPAMALAGCTGVFIGFESLNPDNLSGMGKRTADPDDFARRVEFLHAHGIQVNGSFILGFDEDRQEVFEATADWIEKVRLESATFHILTPYPGTPLFRRMEQEGRLLHRRWELYDTAHAVFRPRHMTPEELELGYDWIYRRLFSMGSIWRRRPRQLAAVAPYLAMAVLYKKANPLWYLLIRRRWVRKVWQPLVWLSHKRHLFFRQRLEARLEQREQTV